MTKRNRGVSAAELAQGDNELAPQPDAAPVDTAKPAAEPRRRRVGAGAGGGARARVQIAPMPERQTVPARQECVEYLPDPKRHMSEMGLVATGAFICRLNGVRHSVKMGAPKATVPKVIQEMMAESGVTFGHALAPIKPGSVGVTLIDDEDDGGAPRARRTHRPEKNAPERQFRKPRSLPVE